jgi:hypothetical protein
MKTALASLLFLLVLTSVQVIAQTKSINIGQLKYSFDAIQSDGSVQSAYEMLLDATGITVDPIPFSNATMFVGGSSQGTGPITSGLGCGIPPYQTTCDMLWLGGTSFVLPSCASLNAGQMQQNCISIALQLVSPTGKNFSFQLADGEQFCTHGITNIFLLAKQDKLALDPRCGSDGFCAGASVPIILHAAPAKSCSR